MSAGAAQFRGEEDRGDGAFLEVGEGVEMGGEDVEGCEGVFGFGAGA